MKTLKIQIPDGYEIDDFDKLSGEIKLKEKPKNVMERIKTVADILADHNITPLQFDVMCERLEVDEINYRILKLLTKSLNESWLPDWDDSNQAKYYAWFYMGGSAGFRFDGCGGWPAISYVGSRLCFKSRELAEYSAQQFTSVYKQFMMI